MDTKRQIDVQYVTVSSMPGVMAVGIFARDVWNVFIAGQWLTPHWS